MPSRRMIDPGIIDSESLAGLPFPARYLFCMMFAGADDQGRMRGNPALIRAKLLPWDDVPLADVLQWLELLQAGGFVQLYEVDGVACLQVLNWWKYQHPSWAWPSKLPPPPEWTDRLCYRRGNVVVRENWPGAEAAPVLSPAHSEPTVSPLPAQSEPGVGSAPSTSGSDSGSGDLTEPGAGAELAPTDPPAGDDPPAGEPPPADPPPPPPPSTFAAWSEKVQVSRNRPATLVEMFVVLYPGADPPGFSRIGKFARDVGGAGRAAELLWQHSTRPPTGDVLSYLLAVYRKEGNLGEQKPITVGGQAPRALTREEWQSLPSAGSGGDGR